MKRVLSTGDIASVNAAVADDDNDGVFTQIRSRKNRKKSKNITADVNRSQQPSRAKAVGLNLSSSTTQEHDVGQDASQSELSKVVQELRETVNTQQIIIDKLKCRLDFVLSYLDIDVTQPSSDVSIADASGTAATSTETYATAVTAPASVAATTDDRYRPTNFRDAVVSAVYTNQRVSESRANSVIVTGLDPQSDHTDAELFKDLCESEFDIITTVKYCKRLGSTDTGRIQPLMVILPTVLQANEILSCAKKLRKSRVEAVRNSVYINRNLTKIEARMAYEERCRRRQMRLQRQHGDSMVSRPSRSAAHSNSQQRPAAGRHDVTRSAAAVDDGHATANSSYSNSSVAIATTPVSHPRQPGTVAPYVTAQTVYSPPLLRQPVANVSVSIQSTSASASTSTSTTS